MVRIIKRKRHNRTVYKKDSVKGAVFYLASVIVLMIVIAINMGL